MVKKIVFFRFPLLHNIPHMVYYAQKTNKEKNNAKVHGL